MDDDPDMGDDFSRSPASLLGERVGITQFHDRERAAAEKAAAAKPVARRHRYPFNAFRSLLGIAGDVSAPTFDELYSGEWEHPTCCG